MKCKNCGRDLADHPLMVLELCKKEYDANKQLTKLRKGFDEWERKRREFLTNELAKDTDNA